MRNRDVDMSATCPHGFRGLVPVPRSFFLSRLLHDNLLSLVDVDTLLCGLSAKAATPQVIPCIGSVRVLSEVNNRDTGDVIFSVAEVQLDTCTISVQAVDGQSVMQQEVCTAAAHCSCLGGTVECVARAKEQLVVVLCREADGRERTHEVDVGGFGATAIYFADDDTAEDRTADGIALGSPFHDVGCAGSERSGGIREADGQRFGRHVIAA